LDLEGEASGVIVRFLSTRSHLTTNAAQSVPGRFVAARQYFAVIRRPSALKTIDVGLV
jgi:hypothetical protein